MEADWDELSRITIPAPSPHGLPTNGTAVAFDDVMELLWVGNEYVSDIPLFTLMTRPYPGSLCRVESPLSTGQNYNAILLYGHILYLRVWYGRYYFMSVVLYHCLRRVYT